MPGVITVPTNYVGHNKVGWIKNGKPEPAPADAVVVSSDTSIASGALHGDMTDLNAIPAAVGSCTLNIESASWACSDVITVNVIAAVEFKVEIDTTTTTYTPKVPGMAAGQAHAANQARPAARRMFPG